MAHAIRDVASFFLSFSTEIFPVIFILSHFPERNDNRLPIDKSTHTSFYVTSRKMYRSETLDPRRVSNRQRSKDPGSVSLGNIQWATSELGKEKWGMDIIADIFFLYPSP